MAANENGNPRPDGIAGSFSLPPWNPNPVGFGIGGAYYWNPGSLTAPRWTVTGSFGAGGQGVRSVFLRKGMTSADTLGYGVAGSTGFAPSVTVNSSIPDANGIPQPWKGRVSSVDVGGGVPGLAATYTWTPQQIADFITTHGLIGSARLSSALHQEAPAAPHPSMHFVSPAMGPDDELPPFFRKLQSGHATIGAPASLPVPFLTPSQQNPLGNGMGDLRSSAGTASFRQPSPPAPQPRGPGGSSVFDTGTSPVVSPPSSNSGLPGLMTDAGLINPANPDQPPPGGLPGLILEYLRDNPGDGASR